MANETVVLPIGWLGAFCWWWGEVCNQKTSKCFMSHREECIARHIGVSGFYYKLEKGNTKGSMLGPRWNPEAEGELLFSRCF
jgi:hypothetical protein